MLTHFVLIAHTVKSEKSQSQNTALKKLSVISERGMVSTLDCEDIKQKNFIFLVGVPPKLLYQRRYQHSPASLMVDNCEVSRSEGVKS